MTNDQAQAVAEAVVADGFDAHRSEVATLVAAARRHGVAPILLDIAGGDGEPPAARYRALGRVVAAYCGRVPVATSSDVVDVPDARRPHEPLVLATA